MKNKEKLVICVNLLFSKNKNWNSLKMGRAQGLDTFKLRLKNLKIIVEIKKCKIESHDNCKVKKFKKNSTPVLHRLPLKNSGSVLVLEQPKEIDFFSNPQGATLISNNSQKFLRSNFMAMMIIASVS